MRIFKIAPAICAVIVAAVGSEAATAAATAGEACRPVAAAEIQRQWEYHRSLKGARELVSDRYQCMQIESTAAMVCRTIPGHAAHPSIVIRTIIQDGRGVSLKMESDTAASCESFLGMMKEFEALNETVREEIQKRGGGSGK
jgi:hypothetical protein